VRSADTWSRKVQRWWIRFDGPYCKCDEESGQGVDVRESDVRLERFDHDH
jgi:hypothetical protein